MPARTTGFLNIRGKIPVIRGRDREIADLLDQIQVFCDYVNRTLGQLGVEDRRLAIFVDPSGAINLSGQSIRLTGKLFASGDTTRVVSALRTPTSATDTAELGDLCWSADHLYLATDINTWKRVAIATF